MPDRCHDGSSDRRARPGPRPGRRPPTAFCRRSFPRSLASKAYKEGGLLVITVDEAPSTGAVRRLELMLRSTAVPQPARARHDRHGPTLEGRRRGRRAALSPYVKAGTTNQEQYNHFSLLRTIEDLYGLKHLGYAGPSGVSSFNPSVYSAYKSG